MMNKDEVYGVKFPTMKPLGTNPLKTHDIE